MRSTQDSGETGVASAGQVGTNVSDELAVIAALLAADRSGANGDDAAIVHVPGGLACISTDTAVEGVHLHPSLTAREMGARAMACALSDLAAMAATPIAAVVAVSVPEGRWQQVEAVVAGARERAAAQRCPLVGGDLVVAAPTGSAPAAATPRTAAQTVAPGPTTGWSITVTVVGAGAGIGACGLAQRSGMRAGDALFVTGELGRSAAALAALRGRGTAPRAWYAEPPDRIDAARALAVHATAMIDVSDGVASDVRNLATASGCGAVVDLDLLPLGAAGPFLGQLGDPPLVAATAGDDYELLVSAPPAAEAALREALAAVDPQLGLTNIGRAADIEIMLLRRGAAVHGVRGFVHG